MKIPEIVPISEAVDEATVKLVTTPTERSISVMPGVWLTSDDSAPNQITDPESIVEIRTDLPVDHPLYGRRVLRCVPAGCPDIEVVDGELVFIVDEEGEP